MTELNPISHAIAGVAPAIILSIGAYLGLTELGNRIAGGINNTDEKSTRFSLHVADGKTLVIDQKTGEVWSIQPTGSVVVFLPATSGKNFVVSGHEYPMDTGGPAARTK